MEGFEDYEGDALPRKNKHGLELTRSGRPSIKKNDVNEKYTTKYRSPTNKETILGKLLPIGKACALISTIMLGPKIPLEDAGHTDRKMHRLSAAYYCLDKADLSEILNTDPPALRIYLKGIFRPGSGSM